MLILNKPDYHGPVDNSHLANQYMPQKYIKVMLCHKLEVEVNVVKVNNEFFVNIVITPSLELIYKKSNGLAWKFDTFEEAWEFIDAHNEFDLRLILIDLDKAYSRYRHDFKKTEEFFSIKNKVMNAKEALGVYRIYEEIVLQNRSCSLRLNAKFKFCQDSFGGYGYHYNLTYYQDYVIDNIAFSPKEIAHYVDLNMSISKIVKALDLDVLIAIANYVKHSLLNADEAENYEIHIGRVNRVEYLNSFIEYINTFL
jgi:hypothetical protein